MLYFFRFLLFSVSMGTELILDKSDLKELPKISFSNLKILVENFYNQIQQGLTLTDIENVLFFILFLRFLILAIRYNLKTSFFITSIGLFAGYLWYRHLIDLISIYRSVLLKLPFVNQLGIDAVQLKSLHRQATVTDLKLGENVHWYNPGKLIYYAFTKGIVKIDLESGLRYYIDPISMTIANLEKVDQEIILPFYYKIYNNIIPRIYNICTKFWSQFSGIAAYAVITRIGKRYCPYLIRWHWTLLLIIGMIEQIFIYLIYRISYFQSFVLIPQTKVENTMKLIDSKIILQINVLNTITAFIVLIHIGIVLFGLFHAIWGQYFYLPFLVENTELHVGPRLKSSIYSGGETAWQNKEEKEKNWNRFIPKLWYGWFGKGTTNNLKIQNVFKNFIRRLSKKINKIFRK